ncbi:MAG: restriction endonuclease [Candidatus Accumulibacter sp.]|jgi:DNA modification methylase|nr:restriction endonuclease [Accumulibacter sp.]
MTNCLYFGDNLDILREHIKDESVDLIYLDPPFNSARDHNILFASPGGGQSEAQIVAFKDSWQWGEQAEREYGEILRSGNVRVAEMMQALRKYLGENDMMAYLVMMANRLLELHRVLKPTGSLYLHCDPTASHYLKIVLDGVLGVRNYRNELIWKRSNPKSHAFRNFPACTDTILRYTKTDDYFYRQPHETHDREYVESAYRYSDEHGPYRLLPLLNPNDKRPNLTYEFLGVTRVWRWTRERMEKAWEEGRIVQSKPGAVPQYKKYLNDSLGKTVTNCWTDIQQVSGNEALGYPTQKPLALLERIVQASSNEGGVVLDPFCGCGTAVHAAQKLERQWIGIDITHLAIALIEKRMKDAFPGIALDVRGTPKDIDGARDLAERDKYQFQWWACSLVNAQPWQGKKKGADSGIDGLIYFQEEPKKLPGKIVVSVKGGKNVGVAMLRDLAAVIEREEAEIGLFVTLALPTKPMRDEAVKAGYYESPVTGKAYPRVQILTVAGLLEGSERPEYPDLSQGGMTFKKAKREEKKADQKPLF